MSLLIRLGLKSPTTPVSPVTANSMAAAGEVVFIDVREDSEVKVTGLPRGSASIPLSSSDFVERVKALSVEDSDKPIAISCLTGTRSSMAARKLYRAEFADLLIIKGGYKAWAKEGLPVVKANGVSDR